MTFTTLSGETVPVVVKRRKGTRHQRLRLGHQNQILASVPWHAGERSIVDFIEHQRDWLEAQLGRAPKAYTLRQWLAENPRLSASGDVFFVRVESSSRRRADYCFDRGGSELVLRLPQIEEPALRRLVRQFAKDALVCRVAYQAKLLGLDYSALSVRDQSSRWGSCSARRSISLNWRLILLEPALQDYVILHELAHLTEMNHSRRFWALLDCYDPQRVEHEAELDRVSSQYMRIASD